MGLRFICGVARVRAWHGAFAVTRVRRIRMSKVTVRARLLLAYGAAPGRAEVEPLVAALGAHFEQGGVEIHALALDPEASELESTGRLAVTAGTLSSAKRLFVGGFSLGARLAAAALSSTPALGLVGFGYPFYSRTDPSVHPGLDALLRVRRPGLIVQGTRDAHGNRERVHGLVALPDCVELHWLPDGNHHFVPRPRAARTHEEFVAEAASSGLTFIRRTLA